MTQLLLHLFVKNYQDTGDPEVRGQYGRLAGLTGIAVNVLLCAGKFLAGLLSGSVAILADAVNNLSDAASSVVTLLGFRLAAKPADDAHPYGYHRAEYLAGLSVAALILVIAVELFKSSLKRILAPETVAFTAVGAAILVVSIAAKLWLCLFYRRLGRAIRSEALTASAADSRNDVISTAAVLLSYAVTQLTSIPCDGWAGLFVALFIFWSGLGIARDTIAPLLGEAPDETLVHGIANEIRSYDPRVLGIHDLIVHDYGPGRRILSLHAEVPANGDILALHDVVDTAERELATSLGCMATIHMDPVVTDDGLTAETREKVAALARIIDPGISIHDFRMVTGPTHTNVIFDVVVPFDCKLTDRDVADRIRTAVRTLDGNYYAVVEVEKSYV